MRLFFAFSLFLSLPCLAQVDIESVQASRRIGLNFREGDTLQLDDRIVDLFEEGKIRKPGQQYWEIGNMKEIFHSWGKKEKRSCRIGLVGRSLYSDIPTPRGGTWKFVGANSEIWPYNMFELDKTPQRRNQGYHYEGQWVSSLNPKVAIFMFCYFSADANPITADEKETLSIVQTRQK